MEKQQTPMPEHLVIDWRIDVLGDLNGAIFSFLLLPMEGDGPQQARAMRPLGIGVRELKRLHADLGELVALVERGGPAGMAPPVREQ